MFESVEKYLQGKKLRYEKYENQYSIEFADYGTCSYLCKGWKILMCPNLADCEELAGEEWVDIKYRFRGIEDDALFQQQWIELKQELVGYKYDNITMFDKFTNSIFAGSPEISTVECLSYEDTPADMALDNTIVLPADIVQKLMYNGLQILDTEVMAKSKIITTFVSISKTQSTTYSEGSAPRKH